MGDFRRFLWPVILLGASFFVYIFHNSAFEYLSVDTDREAIRKAALAGVFLSGATLLARLIVAALNRRVDGRRRIPKLLGELITAALFVVASVATIAMLLGQSTAGAVASSGLIIAIFGFAIRNVLADVLSGIALGLEAPFRIGDWIEIDGTTRGKVIEIGWRTTRLLTRDDTYMILPNSQISRQRMTNFSAPKKHYRASLDIVLGHDMPVETIKCLLAKAAFSAKVVMPSPQPDVRALAFSPDGVRYAVRYWVPSFVDDLDCRDQVLVAIDDTLRAEGVPLPSTRIQLLGSSAAASPLEAE